MSYIRGALLAGGFRSWNDLKSMSLDDQRNTVIVELVAHSHETGGYYQAMDDRSLAGAAALVVMMRVGGIRDDSTLRGMTLDGMRNTFIAELGGFTGLGDSLQGFDNLSLVEIALTGHQGVRGVLLLGGIVGWRELNAMSFDDQRNALINTLADHSSHSIGYYQGLPDSDLSACGGVMLLLLHGGARDAAALRTMSNDDQRNTLIVELASYTKLRVPRLQGFSNASLVRIALGDPFLPNTHERLDPDPPIKRDLLPAPPIEVHYVGLQCFAETDVDFGSDSDEPYLIITTASPFGQETWRSQVYDDVDSGESRTDDRLLYRGPADGLAIVVQIMEHDNGDPDKFRDIVNEAADEAAGGIAGALTGVPVVGVGLSALFLAAWAKWGADIKEVITELIGDQRLGTAEMLFDRRRLADLAIQPLQEFRGVHFTLESPLVEGAGASYKAAFTIRPA